MDFNKIMVPEIETEQALVASIANELIAIPVPSVLTIENVAISDISLVDQSDVIYLRGRVIPLIYLRELYGFECSNENQENITVVVCMHNDACIGLVVDSLVGQKDIESKSLGILSDNQFFSGASIIEEDSVAMVVSVESFIA